MVDIVVGVGVVLVDAGRRGASSTGFARELGDGGGRVVAILSG
jgi:hypothetical protein